MAAPTAKARPESPENPEVEAFLARLTAGGARPAVCLVTGDLVLAEPAAERIAAALAATVGCPVESHRRPVSIAPLLADLATYSLFAPGKVLLALDTAVLADRGAAAALIDDAAEGLPTGNAGAGEARSMGARERQAAVRLLQALHLFDVDPYEGGAENAISELPGWALEGGPGRKGKRGKRQLEDLKAGLAALLEGARREGIQGTGGSDLSELSAIVRGGRDGLPAGHALVLAERTAPADHPVVALLAERHAVLALGGVEAARGGAWEGVEGLAAELERQTGTAIARDALAELARRTLRQEGDGKKGGSGSAEADSTARFAGEYRKLAGLVGGGAPGAPGGKIDRKLVLRAVEDRGEEDVWQLLDAVAQGRPGEALDRLHRLIGSAEDPLAMRLSFFSLFASFCRQLTALRGMMRLARVPAGDENYSRFKDRHAPSLQGSLPTGGKNPLAGIHPFRLHRAYLAASRLPEPLLARLPALVLDTELLLKGEGTEADAALAQLVGRVAASARR